MRLDHLNFNLVPHSYVFPYVVTGDRLGRSAHFCENACKHVRLDFKAGFLFKITISHRFIEIELGNFILFILVGIKKLRVFDMNEHK